MKTIRKVLASLLLIASFLHFNSHGFSQTTLQPRFVIAQQPDSPLLLLAMYVDTSDPLRPRFTYSLTNLTDKPIRAYAIRSVISLEEESSAITDLAQALALKSLLKPHESRQGEEGSGMYQTPPDKIEFAVDFVEFADGTLWGDDKGKSGERLDGFHVGGKAALKKCREILASEGVDGLDRTLESQNLLEPESISKSVVWSEGFKWGVSSVRNRLKRSRAKGGLDEVKRELDRPFDSTDGREEP